MYTVGIITLSDKGNAGEREDLSGPVIRKIVEKNGYHVVSQVLLPDDRELLKKELLRLADEEKVHLVLTTGGTGFSPRDITPEVTLEVADRNASGIAEAMRAFSMTITKKAMLSRAVSVLRKKTLIVNLPGSPKAVRESLDYIIDVLAHGLDVLQGDVSECTR